MTVARSLAGLDPAWFAEVVGAPVESITVEPLAFTGATTDLARVRIGYRGASDGPASLVVKIRGVSDVQRRMDQAIGLFEREARFYGELAARVPIGSPRCLHVGDGDRTPLVLEDLDGLRMGDQVDGLAVADAEALMVALAGLHAAYWDSPELDAPWLLRHDSGDYPGLVAALVASGVPALRQRFADRAPAKLLDGVVAQAGRWDRVLAAAAQGPPTLVHNDCRLDNVFFAADGTPTLIDWQVVSRTRGAQDVANLLAGSMPADDLAEHWERLLRLYHDALTGHGVSGYGFDQLLDHYRVNVFFPLGAGMALLGAMDIGDGRSLGELIVDRCLRHIDAIGALEALT
jgi:hypothetical protein